MTLSEFLKRLQIVAEHYDPDEVTVLVPFGLPVTNIRWAAQTYPAFSYPAIEISGSGPPVNYRLEQEVRE